MYTLYYAPGAASLAVHQALIELDVPHQLQRLDLQAGAQRSAEYLRLNPNGVVPTLLIDDQPAYECAALLLLLAERHPAARLAPPLGSRERVAYLQWIAHLANTLQPAFRMWFYPSEPAGADNEAAIKLTAQTRIESGWDRLDAHLRATGPFLAGADFSVADIYCTMLMRWSRNMPRPATEWPALRALSERVKARPSWNTLNDREALTEWR